MTQPQPSPGRPGPGQPGEPVGGLGEEAVKLLHALRDLAGDPPEDTAETAASVLREAASSAQRIGDHVGGGGESCRYCPVCQAISLVRATPPEVRHHLAVAGTSLLQAVSALMATAPPDSAAPDSSARAPQRPPSGPQPNRDGGPAEWEDD